MRLGGLGSQIASSTAALAIALLSLAGSGGDALAVGAPPGGFVISPGTVATFTGVTFSACNRLTWGYQLSGGSNQGVFTFPGGCKSGV